MENNSDSIKRIIKKSGKKEYYIIKIGIIYLICIDHMFLTSQILR